MPLPFALDPCLPTRVAIAPAGPQWVHEIKHDGYRLMVRRTAAGIRIRTRNGHDWTDRFPWIVEAAGKLRATSFVIDGEGVILRQDGVSDFDRLHSRRHDDEVQLLGFDLLELDGTDLRREPLENRKATLASLLRRSRAGIQLVEHIEADDGGTVFDHACRLGLEGIVSKRRDAPYPIQPCRHLAQGEEPRAPGDVSRLGRTRFLVTPGAHY
jgi:ATP-dependent DNA ligase